MGSRLIYDLAEGLAAAGFRAVRFDFRGVGRSEGSYGEGIGEVDDALAVFDAVQLESGRAPFVVGYSFGAAVACRLATLRDVPRTVLVACPPRATMSRLVPADDAPRVVGACAIIVGDRDEHASVAESNELASLFATPAQVTVISGAGHFLEPTQNGAVLDAVRRALGP